MAIVIPNGKQQYFSDAGTPLAGGLLYTYAAGTTTPKTTWADAAETAPNANPIVLNARGEATAFWKGAYKVELRTAGGAVIWTVDNVSTVQEPLSAVTLAISGNANIAGTLGVTGAFTLGGPLTSTSTIQATQYTSTVAAGVALAMGDASAIRNSFNGFSSMYFDVSIGGAAGGEFVFRTTNGFLVRATINGNGFQTTSIGVGTAPSGTSGRIDATSLFAARVEANVAYTPPVVITVAGTTVIDCNASNVFTLAMTANISTLTINNANPGQSINMRLTQDGTGSRTIAWPASFKWTGGSAPVLSTTAGRVDLLVATYFADTGFWLASLIKDLR